MIVWTQMTHEPIQICTVHLTSQRMFINWVNAVDDSQQRIYSTDASNLSPFKLGAAWSITSRSKYSVSFSQISLMQIDTPLSRLINSIDLWGKNCASPLGICTLLIYLSLDCHKGLPFSNIGPQVVLCGPWNCQSRYYSHHHGIFWDAWCHTAYGGTRSANFVMPILLGACTHSNPAIRPQIINSLCLPWEHRELKEGKVQDGAHKVRKMEESK